MSKGCEAMLFAWFVVLWRALLESALGIFMWLLGKPRIAHLKVTCGDSDLERCRASERTARAPTVHAQACVFP